MRERGETEQLTDLAGLVGLEEPAWVDCRATRDDGNPCTNRALTLDRVGRCIRCVEAAERVQGLVRAFERAGVPDDLRWVTPEHPTLAKIIGLEGHHQSLGQRLRALVHSDTLKTITLLGNSGEGKTHLAAALIQPVIDGSMFTLASTLSVSDRQHRYGKGEATLLARALRARALVIDELEQPDDPKALATLKRVIWERWQNGRRTIITSGLTGAELMTIFGDGAARRFGIKHGPYGDVLGEAKAWNLTSDRYKRIVQRHMPAIQRCKVRSELERLANEIGVPISFVDAALPVAS